MDYNLKQIPGVYRFKLVFNQREVYLKKGNIVLIY